MVRCGELEKIENGQYQGGNLFLSEKTYSCNGGFSLQGNRTRTCERDGTWSGSKPVCTATGKKNYFVNRKCVSLGLK